VGNSKAQAGGKARPAEARPELLANSSSTTSGAIWIGGATTQNPMPTQTMDGSIHINCSGGTFASTGKVKLVGCAPYESKPADICIHGTNSGQIKQTLSCIDFFSVQCNSDCPEYP